MRLDLAILDFRMPEMDGCRLGNEIRARGIAIPLIMLTGWLFEVPASCIFSRTIQKGGNPTALLQSIAAVLNHNPECSECDYARNTNTCSARSCEEPMNRNTFRSGVCEHNVAPVS